MSISACRWKCGTVAFDSAIRRATVRCSFVSSTSRPSPLAVSGATSACAGLDVDESPGAERGRSHRRRRARGKRRLDVVLHDSPARALIRLERREVDAELGGEPPRDRRGLGPGFRRRPWLGPCFWPVAGAPIRARGGARRPRPAARSPRRPPPSRPPRQESRAACPPRRPRRPCSPCRSRSRPAPRRARPRRRPPSASLHDRPLLHRVGEARHQHLGRGLTAIMLTPPGVCRSDAGRGP